MNDPALPSLAKALHPDEAAAIVARACPELTAARGRLRFFMARVLRHKPGRRCVIEYQGEVERDGGPPTPVSLVGKVRARGADRGAAALHHALCQAGFDGDSPDGVSVPRAAGVVPELGMWLQHKVPGVPATELLPRAGGPALARRIAAAVHKLHQARVPAARRHALADEVALLRGRLGELARERPAWAARLERLLGACRRLAAAPPGPEPCGIHRDFYPDQVLVNGPRLYLLDFDLYCEGDRGLDAGNFAAHLTEQALRTRGSPAALADCEAALEERFVELAGEASRPAVRAYAALTLARHVFLSTRFPERRAFTAALLELSEARLSAAARARYAPCGGS